MIVYPLGSFSWALLKVGPVFDSNCPTAIQLSRRYMTIPYFQVQINLIGAVTGHTPRYYYLNVIGLCEKKMGNIRESVKTFEELQTYTARSPYDNDEIEATKNILNRLQWKIKESNAQN